MRYPTFTKTCMSAVTALALVLTPSLVGCGGAPQEAADESTQGQAEESVTEANGSTAGKNAQEEDGASGKKNASDEDGRLDLLVLVNKDHALPDDWENKIELEGATNTKGDYVEVDKIAFDAFAELQKDLLENEGITIELNSGYRSVEEQQAIWDQFMEEYGEEYVLEFVAEPGHSEHHTGLALDALLVEDGVPIVTNDDIFAHEDTWEVIHSYLAKHGFILRYLDGMENITGYTYEPWHLRYVGTKAAKAIMSQGITLEEYLDEA